MQRWNSRARARKGRRAYVISRRLAGVCRRYGRIRRGEGEEGRGKARPDSEEGVRGRVAHTRRREVARWLWERSWRVSAQRTDKQEKEKTAGAGCGQHA